MLRNKQIYGYVLVYDASRVKETLPKLIDLLKYLIDQEAKGLSGLQSQKILVASKCDLISSESRHALTAPDHKLLEEFHRNDI